MSRRYLLLLLCLLGLSRLTRTFKLSISSRLHLLSHLLGLICQLVRADAQYSVKLVGAGGSAAADLYNSYGTYYGYSKDNVALSYTASSGGVEGALVSFEQNLVDFVGADTALDADQFNGVEGLVQLPTVGLPLVIGYNLPTLLSTDSLVRRPSSLPSRTHHRRGKRASSYLLYTCGDRAVCSRFADWATLCLDPHHTKPRPLLWNAFPARRDGGGGAVGWSNSQEEKREFGGPTPFGAK
jgi:hypothetical protein